jgi:LEA14-like dessication related protein
MRKNHIHIALIIFCLALFSCANPKSLVYQDVKNFSILTLSLQPDIGMDIQFYNPNSFGVTLKDANIDLYINDKFIGKGTLQKTFHVPAADTFLLPVKLKADLSGLFAHAYSLLANREVKVRLEGSVKSGKGVFITIPIHYEGTKKLDVAEFK